MIDWLNDNQGAAIVFLTLALVAATIWSAWTTQKALRLGRDQHELDRRTRRGANVVVRFHEGTGFHAWTRGPSDATAIRVRLEVADWRGPPLGSVLLQVRQEPTNWTYQAFTDRHDVPLAADGRIGQLVGECTNEYGEREPIRSAPFRVRVPQREEDGNLMTYEQVT